MNLGDRYQAIRPIKLSELRHDPQGQTGGLAVLPIEDLLLMFCQAHPSTPGLCAQMSLIGCQRCVHRLS